MADKKIRAILIIESMGRPADYLKESFKDHISKMKEDKEIELISEKLSDCRRLSEITEEMYSCFAEIEIRVSSFSKLITVIFDYMPSSIEIMEPEKLELNLNEANNFVNDLSGRLHKYDEITKVSQLKAQQLANKLNTVYEVLQKNKEAQDKIKEGFVKAEKEFVEKTQETVKTEGKTEKKSKAKKEKT